MGAVFDAIGSLVGFGGSPKASGGAGTSEVRGAKTSADAVRAKLLGTQGGVGGEELLSGSTKKRSTLLGN